ncbi:RNA-dependent RNA polymerase [Entomortierella parvispora]|uniref:RNA-dependent RNA polymerase n=1 Tax=Entomortierella parvispora TaxID=205924 RepID=A0A9P3M260_9FUNG|nr:RNA-dependent RNA polymerase [Entomortierella parvispora]
MAFEALSQELYSRPQDEPVRLRFKKQGPKPKVNDLKLLLDPFGRIHDLTVDPKEDGSPGWNVSVLFTTRPQRIPELLRLKIDEQSLDWSLAPFSSIQRPNTEGRSIELGVKLNNNTFYSTFCARSNVKIQIKEHVRVLKIDFSRRFERDGEVEYEIESRFETMEQGCIQIERTKHGPAVITIQLRYPPIFSRFDPNIKATDENKWSRGNSLRRVLDIPVEGAEKPGAPTGGRDQKRPTEPNPGNVWAKLGKWLIIRVTVEGRHRDKMEMFAIKCQKYNLLAPTGPPMSIQDKLDVPVPRVDLLRDIPFDVRYLLESAISHNYLLEYDLTETFCNMLLGLEPAKASYILESIVADRKRIWNPEEHLAIEIKKLERTTIRPRIVPNQCVYLRKITVTPTTVYLLQPTVETSNRIIRNFSSLSDYFLRVEFSDEGHQKLWPTVPKQQNSAIHNRIFETLGNGVLIGYRKYEFLAFSASQLRENAAWFFCSEKGEETPDTIRAWMGDFSHIRSIAKYGARMGQCFSSTTAIATLQSSEVRMIDDIEHDGHNFSDGCGKISPELARQISIELEKETTPSAFQIRLGGSKGVLAYSAHLRGRRVEIRPSMKKFDVAHNVLEVIRTSGFLGSHLNRQIIILLTSLGVPDQVILDLRDKMVQNLDKIESDDQLAMQTLLQNWDENGTSKMMVMMIRAGFLARNDPMIKNLLTLFKLQSLEELRKKARIFVPKGAYLLGICDDTGTLKEGEIFVQVSSMETANKRTVIEGSCVVVRSPCFHPGDVRVVRAVRRRELMHLHDVVVFSTKGLRGIPNMCSGGDLDGDDFTLIWDPNIVNRVQQVPPMVYHGKEILANSDVTIADIQKFFVQYAVSNNLGVIANAHLALSDQLEEGPRHGKCLRLAQLHSDAVDFPKSGRPAEMIPELRAKKYPDFMEKRSDQSYPSKRVLGKIFRDCGKPLVFSPKDYSESFNRQLLVDGYEQYMEDAYRCKAEYDDEVRSLMNQYGVKSDLEVVSGFIMDTDMITNQREHEVRKSIVAAYKHIKKRFRLELEKQFYGPEGKTVMESNIDEVRRKATAWYAVCYQNLHHGQPYTFAWIAYDYICESALSVRTSPVQEKRAVIPAPPADGATEPLQEDFGAIHDESTVDLPVENTENPWAGVAHPNMMELAMAQERARAALVSEQSTTLFDHPDVQSNTSTISLPSIRLPDFAAVEYPMPVQNDLPSGAPTTLGLRQEPRARISYEAGGYLTVGPDVTDDELFQALYFS